jgi:hypothetical protein
LAGLATKTVAPITQVRAAIAIRLAVSLNPPVMTPPILLLNDAC